MVNKKPQKHGTSLELWREPEKNDYGSSVLAIALEGRTPTICEISLRDDIAPIRYWYARSPAAGAEQLTPTDGYPFCSYHKHDEGVTITCLVWMPDEWL